MTRKSTGWTPEKRQRVAAQTKKQKPWRHSTGPKTIEGKETVSQNAYKHGFYSRDMAHLNTLLKAQNAFLKMLEKKTE